MRLETVQSANILNSNGKWTIETTVKLEDGTIAEASVPEGVSKGTSEAVYIDPDKAVQLINNKLNKALKNFDVADQNLLDQKLINLDGTENKSNLGANTTLSLSIACARAMALSQGIELYRYLNKYSQEDLRGELPTLMVLVFEGGAHAHSKIHIQEFLVLAESPLEGLDIYLSVKKALEKQGLDTNVGAEGAFSPRGVSSKEVLSLIRSVTKNGVSLDVAAGTKSQATKEFLDLSKDNEFFSVEDPFPEDAWDMWTSLKKTLSKDGKPIIVADDLTTTNPNLIRRAVEETAADAVVIKPNQIGTITEAIRAVNVAKSAGWKIICSHRGGETNDDFIVDFAVAMGADMVKFGGFCRGERIAKYNRLTRIKESLVYENS